MGVSNFFPTAFNKNLLVKCKIFQLQENYWFPASQALFRPILAESISDEKVEIRRLTKRRHLPVLSKNGSTNQIQKKNSQ